MVEFPAQVKEAAEKAYAEWSQAEGLSDDANRARFGRAVRVTAKYLPRLRKEVRSGDLVWYSDAMKTVGGLGEHPGALQHFIAGLPLCQLTHYSERASVWGLKVEDLEVSAVGRFLGIAGHGFDQIDYEVKITSAEPPEKISELARAAAGDCYVTNTLKRSSKVTGKVILNGESLMDLQSLPSVRTAWESNYRRVLPRAKLDSADSRLADVLRTAFSIVPPDAGQIKSVTAIQMRRRGGMEGLVGLTRYCCVRNGNDPGSAKGPPTQTITFYSDLFDEISDRSAVGVIAHELAHAWLNEHVGPEASKKREEEADELARRWGYGEYLDVLAAETEPV